MIVCIYYFIVDIIVPSHYNSIYDIPVARKRRVGDGRVLWPIFLLPYKKQNISY